MGRCTGAVRCRGPGQSAITVHGDGARACTGRCRGPSAITVHGDGARIDGKVQATGAERDNGARGRCTGAREGAGPGQSGTGAQDGAGRDRGRAR